MQMGITDMEIEIREYGDETRRWQYGNEYGNYMIMEVRHVSIGLRGLVRMERDEDT